MESLLVPYAVAPQQAWSITTVKVTTGMVMAMDDNKGQQYKSTLQNTALHDVGKICMRKPLPNFLAITGVVSARQKEGNEKSQSHVGGLSVRCLMGWLLWLNGIVA